jgi:hypothetical protein
MRPIHVMSPIAAMAVYGVPEREVDALIEAFAGTPAEPVRWVVFGTDANLLGALDRQWRDAVDLVLVLVPRTDIVVMDAAPTLLARERLEPEAVVWLHGAELALDPPSGFRATLRIPRGAVEHVPHLLLELLG